MVLEDLTSQTHGDTLLVFSVHASLKVFFFFFKSLGCLWVLGARKENRRPTNTNRFCKRRFLKMRLTEENMCVWAVTWNLLTCFAKFALDFFYFSSWKKLVKLRNVCSGFPSFLSPAGSCCVLLRLTCGWVPNHLLGILGGSCAPSLGTAPFFHPTSLCLFRIL